MECKHGADSEEEASTYKLRVTSPPPFLRWSPRGYRSGTTAPNLVRVMDETPKWLLFNAPGGGPGEKSKIRVGRTRSGVGGYFVGSKKQFEMKLGVKLGIYQISHNFRFYIGLHLENE